MHASLIRIGNSQGVRLPKAVIQQAGLERDLELEVRDGEVVIRAARRVREGWAEAAAHCRTGDGSDLPEWDAPIDDFDGDWA